MADAGPGQFDPLLNVKFQIDATDGVATLGSCFAQHLARHIQKSGFNYVIAEPLQSNEEPTDSARLMANQFSARYGNIYTVRQAVQLLDRAFSGWNSSERPWERDGRYFDPFRPNVYPAGFDSVTAVELSRQLHLAAVRKAFTEADVVVFTLGLTETWMSTVDGAVFPIAPGVVAGEMDSRRHRFVNFTYPEVMADLTRWCRALHDINADIRVLLTVSPVPLNATYENQNVWVSTTYSKAVLRAAAGDIAKTFAFVDYFPSYEIITCPQVQGRYYADDMREVTDLGVSHVMRVFTRHYLRQDRKRPQPQAVSSLTRARQLDQVSDVFCDEDLLDQ